MDPNAKSMVQSLGVLMQRWSELCRVQSNKEITAALKWYLRGRADAHMIDAARIRDVMDPSVRKMPPNEELGMVKAYEMMVNMVSTMSQMAEDDDNDDEAEQPCEL